MEWLPLFNTAFIALVVIYIPGILIMRSCRLTWLFGFVVAPIVSSFVYVCVGAILGFLDISISGTDLFIIALCLSVTVFSISILAYNTIGKKTSYTPISRSLFRNELIGKIHITANRLPDSLKSWSTLFLYIIIAFMVSCFVFLGSIGGPEMFCKEADSIFHYTAIRNFLNRDEFSILDVSEYENPSISGGFYPALFHILAAIVASISTEEIAVCANAVTFVGLSFVYPCGVFGLLGWIFKDKPLACIAGSVCALAFAGYPWGNLISGQVTSNFFANAMLPEVLLIFMMFLESIKIQSNRILLVCLLFCSLIVLIAAQPNSVFSSGIFFVFCLMGFYVWFVDNKTNFKQKMLVKILGCVALFVLACLIWVLVYITPFLHNVIIANDYTTFDPVEAVLHSIVFSFSGRIYPQFALAFLCWIGFIAALIDKRIRWMCGPFLFSMFIYNIDASCSGPFRSLVSGFWYNDIVRTGAIVCIFATPLAALGISVLISGIIRLFSFFLRSKKAVHVSKVLLTILLLGMFFPANYLLAIPSSSIDGENKNAFELIKAYFQKYYSLDSNYALSERQYRFLQEVKEVIGNDSGFVLNSSFDGSAYAYGINDINVFYRAWRAPSDNVIDNPAIRKKMDQYSKSKSIQQAVKDLDIKYVLKLDDGNRVEMADYAKGLYKPNEWKGIESINDKTAGFEPILKDGKMRLYKVKD